VAALWLLVSSLAGHGGLGRTRPLAETKEPWAGPMCGMGGIMMWGAGLLWLLLIIVLVLGAAALVKYLRSGRTK
jgi:hypothetical protein